MEFVKELVYVIVMAAVPVLTTYICRWLNGLYNVNREKIQNERTQIILEQVISMVSSAVTTTTSTYVKGLKANNMFDKEAHIVAFNKTKDAVMAQLTAESAEIIKQAYGDVDVYLDNLIEQLVSDLKDKQGVK